MKNSFTTTIKRIIVFKLNENQDLIEGIYDFCVKNKIKSGMLILIGALKKVKFAYYNQEKKQYLEKKIDKPVEILSCIGNITKKENDLFLHLHIQVADKNGIAFGGHLLKGSKVFALEGIIFEFLGKPITRRFDEGTKLFLFDL